jgi:hypothetical protein
MAHQNEANEMLKRILTDNGTGEAVTMLEDLFETYLEVNDTQRPLLLRKMYRFKRDLQELFRQASVEYEVKK